MPDTNFLESAPFFRLDGEGVASESGPQQDVAWCARYGRLEASRTAMHTVPAGIYLMGSKGASQSLPGVSGAIPSSLQSQAAQHRQVMRNLLCIIPCSHPDTCLNSEVHKDQGDEP